MQTLAARYLERIRNEQKSFRTYREKLPRQLTYYAVIYYCKDRHAKSKSPLLTVLILQSNDRLRRFPVQSPKPGPMGHFTLIGPDSRPSTYRPTSKN